MSKRRFGTMHRAAQDHGVSYYTIRKRAKSGDITVYKLPGRRAACVDLDEVARVMAASPGYASFGPDAVVRDLSMVAEDFEVAE